MIVKYIQASWLPLIFMVMLWGAGCNQHKQEQKPGKSRAEGLFFPALRFDSAFIHDRLDSPQTKRFVLQFHFREGADSSQHAELLSYALDTIGDFWNSFMPDTLRPVPDSLPRQFPGRFILGNNEISRSQLENVIYDSAGKRKSYDYLVFSPIREGVFGHIVYTIQAVKGGKVVGSPGRMMQSSIPSPPARPDISTN